MDQKRLLLAFVLSAVILFGWTYLFPPTPPQQNANSQQTALDATPTPAPTAQPTQAEQSQPLTATPDTTPQRTVIVSTPLYRVELDSRGAVVKSWIIKQNKEKAGETKPIHSVSGTRENPQPLELVNRDGLAQGKSPLAISTGRADVDAALSGRNFAIKGLDVAAPDAQIDVNPGEEKSVELALTDPSSGLEAVKKLTFNADSYTVKLETKLSQSGQPLPNAKIAIGPSIGDQGVPQYTFYSVAPEGVAAVGDSVSHLTADQIFNSKEKPEIKKEGQGSETVVTESFNGGVQWAGVGDTYFAMSLVLPNPVPGLEYRSKKFEKKVNDQDRYLVTAYV